jgi:hypothetical protein
MILILSSRVLALPAALIAGALLALVLLRLGRQRFSLRLFGFALAWGAAAALPPAVISIIEARFDPGLSSFWDAALKAFGLAGLCEEGAKLIVAYLFVRPYAGAGRRAILRSRSPRSRWVSRSSRTFSMYSPPRTDGRRRRSRAWRRRRRSMC